MSELSREDMNDILLKIERKRTKKWRDYADALQSLVDAQAQGPNPSPILKKNVVATKKELQNFLANINAMQIEMENSMIEHRRKEAEGTTSSAGN